MPRKARTIRKKTTDKVANESSPTAGKQVEDTGVDVLSKAEDSSFPEVHRSRRTVASMKRYFEDDDSESEEIKTKEAVDDNEEDPATEAWKTPTSKRRKISNAKTKKATKKAPKNKKSRTPLRAIKVNEGLPSPVSSIKKIASSRWEANQEDWRSPCAIDY